MFVASDEATSGSVIAKPERISASSSGASQRCFVRVAAVAREDLHVARVGRAAVEDLGRDERAAHQSRRAARTRGWSARRRTRARAGTGSTGLRARALACSSSITGGCAKRVGRAPELLLVDRLVGIDLALHEAPRAGPGATRPRSSALISRENAEYRALRHVGRAGDAGLVERRAVEDRLAVEAVEHREQRRQRWRRDRARSRGRAPPALAGARRDACSPRPCARAARARARGRSRPERVVRAQQRRVLGRRAQRPPATKARMPARAAAALATSSLEAVQRRAAPLAQPVERGQQRGALVAEVAVERAVRQAGGGARSRRPSGREVARREQALERVEQALAGVAAALGGAAAARSPARPGRGRSSGCGACRSRGRARSRPGSGSCGRRWSS